ncbi:MAG: SurA N-terminal domain-containing protein [Patescibacteria group bacterium]|nr:SurA N-terminal domain-containing protein [Patescibacteria group bacterium]
MVNKTNLSSSRRVKSLKKKQEIIPEEESVITKLSEEKPVASEKKINIFLVIIILVIIGFGGFLFRDKYLAAIVNGKPVFTFQLNQRLSSVYGKETLENLIVEELIKQEAIKNKVTVGEEEISQEVDKLSKNLGEGTKIEDVLKMQGMTLQDFRNQLKMRLQVNKILEKSLTISDEEVSKYIKDNEKQMTATADADKKEEAKAAIKEQKLSEQIQSWVTDLLAKAKITRFLK